MTTTSYRDEEIVSRIIVLPEGLRPSDSPARALARRFAGALRSRGSLARLARAVRSQTEPARDVRGEHARVIADTVDESRFTRALERQSERIHTVQGCDASVMPQITSANTNASSLMIGERGAALVMS